MFCGRWRANSTGTSRKAYSKFTLPRPARLLPFYWDVSRRNRGHCPLGCNGGYRGLAILSSCCFSFFLGCCCFDFQPYSCVALLHGDASIFSLPCIRQGRRVSQQRSPGTSIHALGRLLSVDWAALSLPIRYSSGCVSDPSHIGNGCSSKNIVLFSRSFIGFD